MRYRVHDLEFDDENERHIARRGITVSELTQLLSNDNVLAENPHGGEGRDAADRQNERWSVHHSRDRTDTRPCYMETAYGMAFDSRRTGHP